MFDKLSDWQGQILRRVSRRILNLLATLAYCELLDKKRPVWMYYDGRDGKFTFIH